MKNQTLNISRICSGNNTIRTVWHPTSLKTIKTVSAGRLGLKGAHRGTPYAAELVGREIGSYLKSKIGLKSDTSISVNVFIAGKISPIGSAIRGLRVNLAIRTITDVTPKPHNGCRARKPRRV